MEGNRRQLDITNIAEILQQWQENHTKPEYNPIPTLEHIAMIIELETDNNLKIDPDPFNNERVAQSRNFEIVVDVLLRNDSFIEKLGRDYLRPIANGFDRLNISAFRLMLDIMVFEKTKISAMIDPNLVISTISGLFSWVMESSEPLRNYATGLIAVGMELQDMADGFCELNSMMIPIMLQRLHKLQEEVVKVHYTPENSPFPTNSGRNCDSTDNSGLRSGYRKRIVKEEDDKHEVGENRELSFCSHDEAPDSSESQQPTLAMQQMMILRYLTSLGKNEIFLPYILEQNVLQLIFKYLNVREIQDAQLTLGAVKYLVSLLCHKKMIVEFMNMGGVQKLLDVPGSSATRAGILKCFLYLISHEDITERICSLPKNVIQNLVTYVLAVLGKKRHFGRCHAIRFFSRTFPFRVILEEFESQNGLEKLLGANFKFSSSNNDIDKTLISQRYNKTIVIALKMYMQAHLYFKVEQLKNPEMEKLKISITPHKARELSTEDIHEKVRILQELMSDESIWRPVEQLHKFGGIALLVDVIDTVYSWKYWVVGDKSSITKSSTYCFEIISICSVEPNILCLPVYTPTRMRVPIDLLLRTAEREITENPDDREEALRALVNCVCAPIRHSGKNTTQCSVTGLMTGGTNNYNSENSIEKVWGTFRWNDGIMALLKLINVEEPIAGVDVIRTLACQAFVGLARSEGVRQIISQLPIFINGRFEALLKKSIHLENQQEHEKFKKYALKLMKQASDRTTDTVAKYRIFNISAKTTRTQSSDVNMTVRITRRQLGINQNRNCDNKQTYSRFCPVKTFKPTSREETFTYCIYSPCQQYLMVGTYSGEVMILNAHSGIRETTIQCHESFIYNMECNRRGNLLLTSVGEPAESFITPPILWNTEPFFEKQLPFENIFLLDSMEYAEFSKHQDKIIGTNDKDAYIYDTETGTILLTLADDSPRANYFSNNKATFSTNDESVLSAGILWDVRSGRIIHKFDRLNLKSNGVFHPNGTDMICNTEIWDLRTRHLLKIVPSLNWMDVTFSPVNHIIYATRFRSPLYPDYWTSFETLDACTYDTIGTYDSQRDICSLAPNRFDTQIAVVENLGEFGFSYGSHVRIYDVGRTQKDNETNGGYDTDGDNDDDEDGFVEEVNVDDPYRNYVILW